jgi:prepilin-type N-terminal cleavage/methylation domain-containing protein
VKLKLYKTKYTEKSQSSEQGFSLIETVIALTTLGVCMAYAMPLFLYAKINNSKSEIRTGALIVSQRVFDNIRSKSFDSTTLTDGKVRDPDPNNTGGPTAWRTGTNATGTNPIVQPADITPANITADEKLLTNAMGRQYRTKITYCEDYNTDPTVCSTQYRKFKVEVSYNGSKVYDLEGIYTQFQ